MNPAQPHCGLCGKTKNLGKTECRAAESRAQRSVFVRQREEIQEVLRWVIGHSRDRK